MKKISASEARKRWFQILDDAAQGEVIVVERKGRRLVLRREEVDERGVAAKTPDYRRLLRARNVDEADRWSWEWRGPDRGVAPRRAAAR